MRRYFINRVIAAILTLFIILTLSFMVVRLMPGSVYNDPNLTPAAVAALEEKAALDPQLTDMTDRCAAAALYHDATEIFTGDLPTPIKYHDPAIRDAYKRVEAAAENQLLRALPERMRPAYLELLSPENEDVRQIVKAADKLAAYIKCVEECAAGNNDFKLALEQTKAALMEHKLPEVDYFLENFGDGFGLTLDELT